MCLLFCINLFYVSPPKQSSLVIISKLESYVFGPVCVCCLWWQRRYCQSHKRTLRKLCIITIEHQREESFKFCWWSGYGYGFWITFRLPLTLQNGVAYFMRFISVSHTVAGRLWQNTAKWLTSTRKWIYYSLGVIQRTPHHHHHLCVPTRATSEHQAERSWARRHAVCRQGWLDVAYRLDSTVRVHCPR